MPTHRLSRNMHLNLQGREYVIRKRLPSGEIQIKDVRTEECLVKAESEILQAVFGNSAELLGHDRNQDFLRERLKKTGVSDVSCLEDDDPRKAKWIRRTEYVNAVEAAHLRKKTPETLRPVIDEVAARIGDPKKPSWMTVIRWGGLRENSGGDNRALVPATKSRGNRKRKFLGRRAVKGDFKNAPKNREKAEKVAQYIDEAIDEVYLNTQRFTVRAVYDCASLKVDEANRFRDPEDRLPVPDRSCVYDAVSKLDDYEVIEARYGKEVADEKYRARKMGPRPTRPLERVECDHTKTDLLVVDPVMMLPIGRAFLTWLICAYTKMILGFYVGFTPPSYLSVMECLKHAVRPKTYVKDKYPDVRNEWKTYGLPETIVVDNGREFHGRNLEDACRQLGINLQYSPKGLPWFRQTVERSYRTVATELHHQLPGTTFSNIFERGDYDPAKSAVITPDTLDHLTHKWIVDVYQMSPHRGIRDVPSLRWDKGVAEWPPALPTNGDYLDVTLGYKEERCVSGRGVEIDCLFYNDDDLALLRRDVKPKEKVIVKRNPSDLSMVHVYDEARDSYLPVPAVDQEYTKGLTLYQHKIICRYVRETLKRNVDLVGLCRAKREIREIVEREWAKAGRPNRTRQRLARYRGEGEQPRREGIERSDGGQKRQLAAGRKPLLPGPASGGAELEIGNAFRPGRASDGATVEGEVVREDKTPPDAAKEEAGTRKKGNSDGAKRSQAGKKSGTARRPPAARPEKVSSNVEGEDDLDMTGWGGDYMLPKREDNR